jgi:hypothetical protein
MEEVLRSVARTKSFDLHAVPKSCRELQEKRMEGVTQNSNELGLFPLSNSKLCSKTKLCLIRVVKAIKPLHTVATNKHIFANIRKKQSPPVFLYSLPLTSSIVTAGVGETEE